MQLQDYIFYYHSNYLKNYKEIMRAQRARNALVSSIFDPEAIFSVIFLPGGGQAHQKMDCILTPAFIGSRCRIRGAHQHPAKQST